MTTAFWIALVQQTAQAPRDAARFIIAQNLPLGVLWTALALIAALNALVLQLMLAVSQPQIPLPDLFSAPLALFVLLAGVVVVYVHVLYWAGLAIGGQGRLEDLLAVIVWLQAIRVGAQLFILLLGLAIPAFGFIASLAVAVWCIWILLNFVATALNLPTVFHAMAVLAAACIGLVLGLAILMSLIGLVPQGV